MLAAPASSVSPSLPAVVASIAPPNEIAAPPVVIDAIAPRPGSSTVAPVTETAPPSVVMAMPALGSTVVPLRLIAPSAVVPPIVPVRTILPPAASDSASPPLPPSIVPRNLMSAVEPPAGCVDRRGRSGAAAPALWRRSR